MQRRQPYRRPGMPYVASALGWAARDVAKSTYRSAKRRLTSPKRASASRVVKASKEQRGVTRAEVLRLIRSQKEQKFIDSSPSVITLAPGSASATHQMFSSLTQGDGESQRVGNQVHLEKITQKGKITVTWGTTAYDSMAVRLICLAIPGDQTSVAVGDLPSPFAYWPRDLRKGKKFEIIYDDVMHLRRNTSSGTTETYDMPYNMNFKLEKTCSFSSDADTACDNWQFYLYFVGDIGTNSGTVAFDFDQREVFTD